MPSFQSSSGHQQSVSEEDDRHNRFTHPSSTENGVGSNRERAASQPPRSSDQPFPSPSQHHFIPSSVSGGRNPWPNNRLMSPVRAVPPQAIPIRSSSFSTQSQGQFGSAMRDRAFPSTYEDDEDGLSDTYDDELYVPPSLNRGRTYGQDVSRSRSQSLATPITRPGPVGSPYSGTSSAMQSWNESLLSNPLNIPGRYGEIKPPGSSRYGSLGATGRSPTNNISFSPSGGSVVGNGFSRQNIDVSNMSPFVRDVGQILLDDGSAFRELWAGMHVPRDENGGGGSGTTSRRHSVSVVQPRRGNIVGFNVPGIEDEPSRPTFSGSYGGRGGLLLSDDDLASDLGALNLSSNEPPPSSSSQHPPQQQQSELTARFIPGQGIQYVSAQALQAKESQAQYPRARAPSYSGGTVPSPISPTSARLINPQQQPFYPQQLQRRPSDATPQPSLADLGKGVPLHSVPSSWPLFIVEFKAGRTDLFYLTDMSLDIHVGDLVIVEADRGKDLGKVVNDSITIAEVEAFQKQQQERMGHGSDGGPPMSPGGTTSASSGKKEINPKMIYGKASPQDTQCVYD
ncbi:hypothetical protein H0H93_009160 [Arthromyces matolae]|nr:hypothetical protein H0H93_009160 [Arthromyces matolae]